jgi:hypothetical protein
MGEEAVGFWLLLTVEVKRAQERQKCVQHPHFILSVPSNLLAG